MLHSMPYLSGKGNGDGIRWFHLSYGQPLWTLVFRVHLLLIEHPCVVVCTRQPWLLIYVISIYINNTI